MLAKGKVTSLKIHLQLLLLLRSFLSLSFNTLAQVIEANGEDGYVTKTVLTTSENSRSWNFVTRRGLDFRGLLVAKGLRLLRSAAYHTS